MTTQLELYNQALGHLKVSALASLAEDTEARYVLDTWYAPALKIALEAGFWHFAMRTVEITVDGSITPSFGHPNAFNKPNDWAKTYQVAADPFLNVPLDDWVEESNCFFASVAPLYVRYVSNSASGYGGDTSKWTGRFQLYFTYLLASLSAPKAAGSSDSLTGDLIKLAESKLQIALGFEALREPPRRPPEGRWNRARRGWGGPERLPGGWQF